MGIAVLEGRGSFTGLSRALVGTVSPRLWFDFTHQPRLGTAPRLRSGTDFRVRLVSEVEPKSRGTRLNIRALLSIVREELHNPALVGKSGVFLVSFPTLFLYRDPIFVSVNYERRTTKRTIRRD
uniref:Uncharacterized protein n=1 Tax=Candidatus Kentrum sp. FW TaxID=2126338 RepID=A0A450SS28_9GAMM|nr:MAG: hypothetical protein BECKFW1821A_GA0114235_10333 [Candidatus Kentron sp. FW]VFJ56658.1 MAG: hypothetical protein BECKFW1821B_GA0114236_10295 [Candidatus Kentron sp. FW]